VKILFLTPSVRLLGARQSLLALVGELPRHGVEPLVVCPGAGELAQELSARGIPVEFAPQGAWRKLGGRAIAVFRQLPALRRTVARFRPDLVHGNEFHVTPHGARLGVPMTTHVRLSITPRQIRNYDLGRARRIVAVSRACADLFAGSGLENRVRVVYNGVDVSRFDGAARDRSLRAQFGWSGDDLVVGLLGLVSPRKNQLVAAEAVALAAKRGVPVRLLLAGDAFKGTLDYGERLRARLAQDDLRDRAKWLPFAKDVLPLYGALDANLLISAEEGFGRTVIEAGALGIPSVGARTGGIPELIVEDETGWLVDEGSAADLAARIERMALDRPALARAGAAARARVREHFALDAHVRAMVGVWREALANQ